MASLLDFLTGGTPQGQGILSGANNFIDNNRATLLGLAGGIAQHGMGGFAQAAPFSALDRNYQQQQLEQQATRKALTDIGVPQSLATAGSLNDKLLGALAPTYFGGWKLVKVGSNPITGEQYMMQGPGGQLRPLDQFSQAGGGAAPGAPSAGGPVQMGSAGMLAQGVKQYDPNLTGEDYLKQFSPEVQAAVKSYMRGDVMPTGNPRTQGIGQAAKTIAQKYGMDIGQPANDLTYAQKRKMQTDIAASSPNSMGGIIANGKSAFQHLAELSDRFSDLGNYSGPNIPFGGHIGTAGNVIGNVIAPSPQTKGKITAVNDNALKYGQEATKFYAGTGGGEAERMNALKTARAETSTGEEQASFLETEKQLMLDRLQQKEAQIRDTLGDQWLQDHPVRTKDLEASIKKIDDNIAKLRGRGGSVAPAGAPAAVPAAPQQSQPQAIPPINQRKSGQIYQTPKGPMIWRGNGWEPSTNANAT